MEFKARNECSVRVSTLLLQVFLFVIAVKGKSFTISNEFVKSFVAHPVLSMFYSNLEKHPRAELLKITYETTFGCKAFMKKFGTACTQPISTKQKSRKILS